tara:strand:+ start:12537 stop:14126 length:1590 start_codon:yes stop_codon:yes gene_type:complete
MNKNMIHRLLKTLIPLLFLIFLTGCQAEKDAGRPNILFIIADDASKRSFGAYGSRSTETPAFDALAKEGVVFTNAYNNNPKCSPARAAILTGRYSWQLEEAANHRPYLDDRWKYYPFLLEKAGYFVGYTGKGWGPGVYKGLDISESDLNPAGHLYKGEKLNPPYAGISKKNYAGNFANFLKEIPKETPFCFWLGTHEPHRAYEIDSWKKEKRDTSKIKVPKFYPNDPKIVGDMADYDIEVEWFDKHLGEAVEYLKEYELLDNTLIIVTSDHGMPFPRVKGQIYEEGFSVPMIAFWKDKIKKGRVVSDFITFPDIAPTLMELAEVPIIEQMTGKSFKQQLLSSDQGRIDPERNHTLLGKERHDIGRVEGNQYSLAYPVRAIRTDHYLYVRNLLPSRWPVGNPEYGFLNFDNSPTKQRILELKNDENLGKFYEMNFGKRPLEELYEINKDADCVNNLADNPNYKTIKDSLWIKLEQKLVEQQDPRILGNGEIFDYYPYSRIPRQQKLYNDSDYDPIKIFESKFDKKVNVKY